MVTRGLNGHMIILLGHVMIEFERIAQSVWLFIVFLFKLFH